MKSEETHEGTKITLTLKIVYKKHIPWLPFKPSLRYRSRWYIL